MSSAQTQPAFVHNGPWDAHSRQHPAMKWMEAFALDFDATKDHAFAPKWYSADWTLRKPDGKVAQGREAGIAALQEVYGPFPRWYHEPGQLICTEDGEGWQMMGQAMVYANLGGKPAEGETPVKDLQGREWDLVVPSAMRFWYRKVEEGPGNEGGVVLSRTEIHTDSGADGVDVEEGVDWGEGPGVVSFGFWGLEGGDRRESG